MRPFWLAVGFLTTFPTPPLGQVRPEEMRAATAFYPAAGYLIGAALALAAWLTAGLPEGLRGGILLAVWLASTGMLHLDGLLDTADALLASKPPAERLRLLADVHVGSFAFGVGFVVLLLKWQALAAGPSFALLLALPAIVRFAVLLPMNLFPAAKADGLGARSRGGWPFLAFLLALPALLALPWVALAVLLGLLLLAYWAARRLGGGLTGDVYGALVELGELLGLLVYLV
ncbi:MAG: adenosylcobinamide-GDP ribazoletransferase [Meiothermus sp.]|uniref:adenosylcobinamide-GDP ribazoletransferase n=1 Tax=Meiothermus sp. TaxID=1955249 RepID=UPI0025F79C72|nr:adenosylcobinamide-GDP ribazoletransferase [Meiothermus sp.]MCS7057729.1 adenosylcobinamide-GDP ribazoletransferase [Meiothermus sp.]MCS7194456.1 adenosylcobinamide-GDP ribazoletransferase [Meiothermus sp.]MCX7741369.1 adenosylcobinamide-GDP ribazoletransferase [Meiothermus sp.]MDW8091908.1 adenosylcobinamide-GDP ribazoletransferase [Meiothermus sp.]MDW8482341.1 adenosylcobinamide-GDP ribazoletransferase [Meiothermus sp.]